MPSDIDHQIRLQQQQIQAHRTLMQLELKICQADAKRTAGKVKGYFKLGKHVGKITGGLGALGALLVGGKEKRAWRSLLRVGLLAPSAYYLYRWWQEHEGED